MIHRAARPFAPRLDALEDRWLPSGVNILGLQINLPDLGLFTVPTQTAPTTPAGAQQAGAGAVPGMPTPPPSRPVMPTTPAMSGGSDGMRNDTQTAIADKRADAVRPDVAPPSQGHHDPGPDALAAPTNVAKDDSATTAADVKATQVAPPVSGNDLLRAAGAPRAAAAGSANAIDAGDAVGTPTGNSASTPQAVHSNSSTDSGGSGGADAWSDLLPAPTQMTRATVAAPVQPSKWGRDLISQFPPFDPAVLVDAERAAGARVRALETDARDLACDPALAPWLLTAALGGAAYELHRRQLAAHAIWPRR